jgi:hypothetical protein
MQVINFHLLFSFHQDVLLLLNKQQHQQQEQEIDQDPLDMLHWQFQEKNTTQQEPSQPVDEHKIAHVYSTIIRDHKTLSENDYDQLYKLILPLNTQETFIIEKLLDAYHT